MGDPNASLAPSNWDAPGEDIIFKYLDVETGLVYVFVNDYWFVYCDEVNAVGNGWWSWLRLHDGVSYPKPDVSKLIPVDGGFSYTEDNETWKTVTPSITERHPATSPAGGSVSWETWEAVIPETAIKVRVFLSNRAIYSTVFNPMTEVVPHFETRPTEVSNWYTFLGGVSITNKDSQSTLEFTSPKTHVYGSTYELTVAGGSGEGALTIEMLAEGTTGKGFLEGNILTITKTGKFKFKAAKAADDTYVATESEIFTLTVTKAENTGTLTVENITKGEELVVVADGATLYFKAKDADDDTYTETVPSEEGEYTVKAVFTGDDNYNELVLTKDFTICKAQTNQPTDSEKPADSGNTDTGCFSSIRAATKYTPGIHYPQTRASPKEGRALPTRATGYYGKTAEELLPKARLRQRPCPTDFSI